MPPTPLHTFRNDELGVEARVWPRNERGRFNVTLLDIDSGETVPMGYTFEEEARAVECAKGLVR